MIEIGYETGPTTVVANEDELYAWMKIHGYSRMERSGAGWRLYSATSVIRAWPANAKEITWHSDLAVFDEIRCRAAAAAVEALLRKWGAVECRGRKELGWVILLEQEGLEKEATAEQSFLLNQAVKGTMYEVGIVSFYLPELASVA